MVKLVFEHDEESRYASLDDLFWEREDDASSTSRTTICSIGEQSVGEVEGSSTRMIPSTLNFSSSSFLHENDPLALKKARHIKLMCEIGAFYKRPIKNMFDAFLRLYALISRVNSIDELSKVPSRDIIETCYC